MNNPTAPTVAGYGFRRTATPLVLCRLAGQGAEFIGFVVLARRLGAASFGALSVAFLLARYGGLIADWGASLSGSRDVAVREDGWTSIVPRLRWRATLSLALTAVFLVIALAVDPAVAPLAVCILARGMNRDWISLGSHRGVRAGVPSLAQGVLICSLSILFVTGDQVLRSSTLLATASVVGIGVSVLLNRAPDGAVGTVGLRWSSHLADPWALIIVLADQILATADTTLIALLGSSAQAGIYAAVYRFPNAWILAQGLLVTGLVPGVSRALGADPTALRAIRRRALRVGAVAAVVGVALIPVALWLLPVIFGEAYASGRTALAILLASSAVSALTIGLLPRCWRSGTRRCWLRASWVSPRRTWRRTCW